MSSSSALAASIEKLWDLSVHEISSSDRKEKITPLLEDFLTALERGDVGPVTPPAQEGEDWHIHQWVRRGILLLFRFFPMREMSDGTGQWWDKIPLRVFHEKVIEDQKMRLPPGSFVRRGTYIGPQAVIMPSFVNIGAHVGEKTMIDYGATIGSCAYIGKECHISAQAMVGGVLEPPGEYPCIVEDNVFVGAGSCISEGIHIEKGSIIASGVTITKSTKILHRHTMEISHGRIPPYSIVVPGTLMDEGHARLGLACAVIAKVVDEESRRKTSLNTLLRDV